MTNQLAFLIYVVGSAIIYGAYNLGSPTFPIFIALFGVTFALTPPRYAFSPLTMLYLYYGAWFVLAPLAADIYVGQLSKPEYSLSFAFAYSVLGISAISISFGEKFIVGLRTLDSSGHLSWLPRLPEPSMRQLGWAIAALYVIATASVALIVVRSGGFAHWLSSPGDAFLNRGGTGVFVVISHFSSLALAACTAFVAVRKKNILPLLVFWAWVIVTSPVHGSKLQISLLLLISIIPWIVTARIWSWKLAALAVGAVSVFYAGMFLRNFEAISSPQQALTALNYFTALENLAISVRDFEPSFLRTFFLPFQKILMLLGITDPSGYFDMNHYLTDIYYPEKWAIKATEQWPVETDLYLNFFFFGGLPLITIFFAAHGAMFGYARRVNTMGGWFASTMMIVGMISHLRGSLYNHVDFYLYPYILLIFWLMNSWKLPSARTDV